MPIEIKLHFYFKNIFLKRNNIKLNRFIAIRQEILLRYKN